MSLPSYRIAYTQGCLIVSAFIRFPSSLNAQVSALSRRKHGFDPVGRANVINDLGGIFQLQNLPCLFFAY